MTAALDLVEADRIVAVPEAPRPTLRRWERQYFSLALLADALAGTVAGVLAFLVASSRDPASITAYYVESLILPFALVAAIGLAGGYERRFMGIGPEEFRRVSLGAFGLAAFAGFLSWATDAQVARSYVVVALPTAIALTGIGRYALRKWVHAQRRNGGFSSRTVVVGPGSGVSEVTSQLRRSRFHGYDVVATRVTSGGDFAANEDDSDLDLLESLPEFVRANRADVVVLVPGGGLGSTALGKLAWALESTGANLVVAPGLIEAAGPRLAVRPVEGLPLLHVEHPRFSGFRRLVKSTYDPVAAVMILALTSPLLIAIAVAIKLDSPGPVLFRQSRVGLLGEPFNIYKFRTMVADADRQKTSVRHLNESTGPLFKLQKDPRVTRVGARLRRASLDELPQLLNVVTGDMSLVGPRPHLAEEIAGYGLDYSRRLFVKPGMTGLWQVSGRSDLSFEESVRLDLRYVENWTLATDLFILWKTVRVVLNRSGAY